VKRRGRAPVLAGAREEGWFRTWKQARVLARAHKDDRRAPVLAGAREKDPLATPQSPLTQMSDDELQAEAIRQESQRRAPSQPVQRPDAGAQNHAPRRPPSAQPASRAAKKQKPK